jgi:hypothetical protein
MNFWRNWATLYLDSAQHGEIACSSGTMVLSLFTASFPNSAHMSVLTLPSLMRIRGPSSSGTSNGVLPRTSIRRLLSRMRHALASWRTSRARENSRARSHHIWGPSRESTLTDGTDEEPRRCSEPEPADSLRGRSDVRGGCLPWLTPVVRQQYGRRQIHDGGKSQNCLG